MLQIVHAKSQDPQDLPLEPLSLSLYGNRVIDTKIMMNVPIFHGFKEWYQTIHYVHYTVYFLSV